MTTGALIQKSIHAAIVDIMREVEAIGKDRKNESQQYKFRGIDDVYNALNPLMAKHGVFSVPEVLEQHREDRQTKNGGTLIYTVLKMKYTFFAADGTKVEAFVVGEGMDSGDKSANKAMSVAHKYALLQIFAIPTEDLKDPENDSPRPQATQKLVAASPSKNNAQSRSGKPQTAAATQPGNGVAAARPGNGAAVHHNGDVESTGNLGEHKLTFGIHKDRQLDKISTADLTRTLAWCKKNGNHLEEARLIATYLQSVGNIH